MRQYRYFGSAAPVASDPDRIVGIATLELDPDAGADDRHAEEAGIDARGRHAGHRPACRHRAGDVGHHHLDASDLERIDVVDHDRAVFSVEGRIAHVGTCGTVEI